MSGSEDLHEQARLWQARFPRFFSPTDEDTELQGPVQFTVAQTADEIPAKSLDGLITTRRGTASTCDSTHEFP